jgi:hypothetical protein
MNSITHLPQRFGVAKDGEAFQVGLLLVATFGAEGVIQRYPRGLTEKRDPPFPETKSVEEGWPPS